MEDPGIDPGTSHMLSERSTIWASPPPVKQFSVEYPLILNSATPDNLYEYSTIIYNCKSSRIAVIFLKNKIGKKNPDSNIYWVWTYSMWKISQ